METHKQTYIVYTLLLSNPQSSSKLHQPLATQAHTHFYEASKPTKHLLAKKLKLMMTGESRIHMTGNTNNGQSGYEKKENQEVA